MKITNTLALCFAAALLWNCNDAATKPDDGSLDPRIPNTVNSITEYAAVTAGYQITSQAAALPVEDVEEEGGFSPDMFNAFADAGICRNLILIAEELAINIQKGGQTADPFAASPRLRDVFVCLEDKAQGFSSSTAFSEAQVLSLIDDCICAGSGSLFGNFTISKYAPPDFHGFAPASAASNAYAPPTLSGYSKPALPGYAPPKL